MDTSIETGVSPCCSCASEEATGPYAITDMYKKIILNQLAFFRHQQRNEPSLTDTEKMEILADIYLRKPSLFLTRYESFLNADDVQFFRDSRQTDRDIDFICIRLMASSESKKMASRLVLERNKRYVQLKRILDNKSDDYFSDKEMRKRDPLMYDRLVGKFLSRQELTDKMHPSDAPCESQTLSSILLDMVDNKETAEKKRQQQFSERMSEMQMSDHQCSGSGSESELEDDDDEESDAKRIESSDPQRKEMSRKIFMQTMIDKFLNGEDGEYYDYGQADESDAIEREILRLQEQDEQDRYFDED